MNNEELRDRAYGLSSFYEKTWESKHLRMQLQRLLYYLKTLSVGLAWGPFLESPENISGPKSHS